MTTVGSPSELRDAFSLSAFHCSLLINVLISHKTVFLKYTHTHTLKSRKDIFKENIFSSIKSLMTSSHYKTSLFIYLGWFLFSQILFNLSW